MSFIELNNIAKKFRKGDGSQLVIADGIDLRVNPGDFIHLQGENGAGKSTLLNFILGLEQPDQGQINVFGYSPMMTQSRLRLGCVLQSGRLPDYLTVRELIELVRSYYPNPLTTDEILKRANLPEKQDDKASKLSGGQMRLVYFALAIAGNPDVLVLDEPTTNLAQETTTQFWKQVKEFFKEDKAVIVVTHLSSDREDFAELVTRTLVLENGKLEESSSENSEKVLLSPQQSQLNQPWLKSLFGQFKVELLQLVRNDRLSLILILILYGLSCLSFLKLPQLALPILTGVAAFNIILLSIQTFGVKIATERENNWVRLLRVTPLPAWVYLTAKILVVLIISTLGVGILIGVVESQLHLHKSWVEWFKLFSVLILGSLPFALMGCAIGYLFNTKVVSNLSALFLGLFMFTSLPFQGLPASFLNWIPFSPFFHYAQLLQLAISSDTSQGNLDFIAPSSPNFWLSLMWLVWVGMASYLVAIWAYRRDPKAARF